MSKSILCLLSFLIVTGTFASEYAVTPYVRNAYVDAHLWEELLPYFLPEDSPEKGALDQIFSERRALSSTHSMRKAGFLILTDPKHKIIVARHPKLKGYLIKAYLDSDDVVEWMWWKKRIDGAHLVQASIDRHGYQAIMKVPKKWIYPLPEEPSPKEGNDRRNFILIVEEMDVLDPHKNRRAYKSKAHPFLLDALYTVIMENLLIDSIYADNIPFCKDGRIAFIDTEHTLDHSRPVEITNIAHYLNSELYDYWEQLVIRPFYPF